jgi:hypothetical protein
MTLLHRVHARAGSGQTNSSSPIRVFPQTIDVLRARADRSESN